MVMLSRQENEKILAGEQNKSFSYNYDQVNYVRLRNDREKSSRKFEDLITYQHLLTISPHCLSASLFKVNEENRIPGQPKLSPRKSNQIRTSIRSSKRRRFSLVPSPSEKLISLGSIFGYQVCRPDNQAIIALFLRLSKFNGTSNKVDSLENFHLTQSIYAALINASITQGHTSLGVPLMFGRNPRIGHSKLSKIIETITHDCITQVNDRNHSYSSFEQIACQSEILFSARRSDGRLTFLGHYPMEYWLVKAVNREFGMLSDHFEDTHRSRPFGKHPFHLVGSSVELNTANESLNYLVSPLSYQINQKPKGNKFRWIEKHFQTTKCRKQASVPVSLLAWISHKVKAQFLGVDCPFTRELYTLPLATLSLAEASSNKTRRTKCRLPKTPPEPIFVLELGVDEFLPAS